MYSFHIDFIGLENFLKAPAVTPDTSLSNGTAQVNTSISGRQVIVANMARVIQQNFPAGLKFVQKDSVGILKFLADDGYSTMSSGDQAQNETPTGIFFWFVDMIKIFSASHEYF